MKLSRKVHLLSTGLIALFVVGVVVVGGWLAFATHELGHALGCLASGRTITRWSPLRAVECGVNFSAFEAWTIALPAYLIPLAIALALVRVVARGIPRPQWQLACASVAVVFSGWAALSLASAGWFASMYSPGVRISGNGDVLNLLSATGANSRMVAAALFGTMAITILASANDLCRTIKAWVTGLEQCVNLIASRLRGTS